MPRAIGQIAFHARNGFEVGRERLDLARAQAREFGRRHHRQRPRIDVHAMVQGAVQALMVRDPGLAFRRLRQVRSDDACERHLVEQDLAAKIIGVAIGAPARARQPPAFAGQCRVGTGQRHGDGILALQSRFAEYIHQDDRGRDACRQRQQAAQEYRRDTRWFLHRASSVASARNGGSHGR